MVSGMCMGITVPREEGEWWCQLPEEYFSSDSGCTYQVRGFLGKGGSGRVYLVECHEDGSYYALKASDKDDFSQKLLRHEAEILSAIRHDAFPEIKEIWESNGSVYLVMTYIQGKTLQRLMSERFHQQRGGFEPDEVLTWMLQLAGALAYLHGCGIIYRDLKPANMIISEEGKVSLIDFGAACRREKPDLMQGMGTPGFAPPEQYSLIRGTGPWTDIYSFGVMLYVLLTGEKPSGAFWEKKGIDRTVLPDRQVRGELCFYSRRQKKVLERLIQMCTAYRPEQRCVSWVRIRQILYFAQRKVQRRQMIWFRQLALAAIAVFVMAYVGTRAVYGQLDSKSYEDYLLQAETAEPEEAEALIFRAIDWMPEKTDAYWALYALYTGDGRLSGEEYQQIQQLIMKNQINFGGESEWAIWCYKMGMAVYLLSDGTISENQVAGWFQKVKEADVQRMDLGVYDGRKDVWQKRADILAQWSQTSVRGDWEQKETEQYRREFWQQVNQLLEDTFCPEEAEWELGIYDKIVSRMMEETMQGIEEHIVSKADAEAVLDRIEIYLGEAGMACEQRKERVLEKETMLKKRLDMMV